MTLRRRPAALTLVPLLAVLTGCAPTVVMDAAPDAANPECAAVIVRLPETLAELPQRETDAQGTSAWGDPTAVLLSCGVPVPGPSEMDCIEVEGIDWLRDASDENLTVFTTYGRDPAVSVAIDPAGASGQPVLAGLADAVGVVPAERACVSRLDVLNSTG